MFACPSPYPPKGISVGRGKALDVSTAHFGKSDLMQFYMFHRSFVERWS